MARAAKEWRRLRPADLVVRSPLTAPATVLVIGPGLSLPDLATLLEPVVSGYGVGTTAIGRDERDPAGHEQRAEGEESKVP